MMKLNSNLLLLPNFIENVGPTFKSPNLMYGKRHISYLLYNPSYSSKIKLN